MSANDGRVVSNFIVQELKGEDITIYVDDLVEGMMKMIDSREGSTVPINVGNPAKQELNWEQKVQLEEGLLKTIFYFRNRG